MDISGNNNRTGTLIVVQRKNYLTLVTHGRPKVMSALRPSPTLLSSIILLSAEKGGDQSSGIPEIITVWIRRSPDYTSPPRGFSPHQAGTDIDIWNIYVFRPDRQE